MTDIPDTTIERLNHDDVFRKFWLGVLFAPPPKRKNAGPTKYAVPSAESLDRVLTECKGDKEAAAKVFGVFVSTLRRWLDERGIGDKWVRCRRRKVVA